MITSFHDRKRRENDVLQKSKGRAEKAEVHMHALRNPLEKRPCLYYMLLIYNSLRA